MQKDYKRLIKTDSSGATNETGIWSDVIFKEKGWTGTNMCDKSETDLIKSIGLIVDNSGYSAKYLKECYYIEFVMILLNVNDKLKRQANAS